MLLIAHRFSTIALLALLFFARQHARHTQIYPAGEGLDDVDVASVHRRRLVRQLRKNGAIVRPAGGNGTLWTRSATPRWIAADGIWRLRPHAFDFDYSSCPLKCKGSS